MMSIRDFVRWLLEFTPKEENAEEETERLASASTSDRLVDVDSSLSTPDPEYIREILEDLRKSSIEEQGWDYE